MTKKDVFQKLEEIFRDVFDDDTIKLREQTVAADIEGWDSLQNIHILVAIEEEFGVRVTIEDAAKIENVGQMVDLIERKAE